MKFVKSKIIGINVKDLESNDIELKIKCLRT